MDNSQCRTCLTTVVDKRLSIERQVNGVVVKDMLEKLTEVKVSMSDMFSNVLCKKCFTDLCSAYTFRTKCKDTARTLLLFEKKFMNIQSKLGLFKQEDQSNTEEIAYAPYEDDENIEMVIEDEQQTYIKNTEDDIDEQQSIISYEIVQQDETDDHQYVEFLDECMEETYDEKKIPMIKEESIDASVKYVCLYCDYNFKTEFGVKRHLFNAHKYGLDPTFCESCNIKFPISANESEEDISWKIESHMGFHKLGKHHSCNKCFEVFKTLKQLETHLQTAHEVIPAKNLKCRACGTIFNSASKFEAHIKQSGCKDFQEKTFRCYICNLIFNMGIAKKKHVMEEHSDKAGSDCPLCLRCKIPSAVAFENHYKTHFVAPRFSCNFCSRTFYESDRLQMHIRRSHDTAKLICHFCSKEFRDKSGIARHILGVHFNERNFKCDFCPKTFTTSYNLKEHLFAIHKKASVTYKCDVCSQDYLYRRQFERHRAKCSGVPEKRRR